MDTVLRADAVVVTGSRADVEIVPVQALRGKELQRLDVVSVADAIRYFSGLQLKDYGGVGGLKTVDIRSMGSHQTGVFYDGVPLGNAQNGQVDLGRFSMENMVSVEVYNGQRGTLLQSARDFGSSGSIYLTSRRPEFSEGRRDNFRLSYSGGSFGLVNPAVLWERRLRDGLGAQLSAEYLRSTGRYRFRYATEGGYDTTAVRRNGDVEAVRVEGGLFGKIRGGEWQTKVYFYNSERGYPGAAVRGILHHEDRQWDRNFFTQSSLHRAWGRSRLLLNAKYSNDRLRYLAGPNAPPADDRYRQHEAYLSLSGEHALGGGWRASVSSDFQYNSVVSFPSRTQAFIVAAAAFERRRVKVQGNLLYTHVNDRSATTYDRLTPTIIATWQVREDLNIRFFHKHIFRMPTLNDLFYMAVGRAPLAPESSVQYNLGAVFTRPHIMLRADAYFNTVRDKIVFIPKSDDPSRWTTVNLGYVEVCGADISAASAFGPLRARLNYSFQRARDLTRRRDMSWYGHQIPYAPWHSGSLVLGADLGCWDLNYSFIYTGERYTARANIPENRLQPWYTHDLSVAFTMGRLRLSADLNNIFDQAYEVVTCYPMPGANVRIKASLTL